MSQGKDYRLHMSSAGVATTPLVEIEMQGDLSINLGKSNERTAFKNGAMTAQGENGWSASFQMALVDPMPAGQTIIWGHHDNGTTVYIEVKSATAARMRFKGPVKVAITELPNPVNGLRIASVELSQDGETFTRDVTT
jgi:hypothetical protein